jgi:hypothetical protein
MNLCVVYTLSRSLCCLYSVQYYVGIEHGPILVTASDHSNAYTVCTECFDSA